jgi:hypothetical protein
LKIAGKEKKGKMTKRIRKHQEGAALVVALIMLLVLTLIGIMALEASRQEVNIVGNQRIYNGAFYAAESGLEDFRKNLPADSTPFNGSTAIAGSGNTYRYKSDLIGKRYNGGIPYNVFMTTAEGTAPNFPNSGRVNIEAVIDVYAGGGGGPGGPVDEIGKYN